MRLYLYADSKEKIGYTPDWIRVMFLAENGDSCELTLDIQGEIAYDREKLNCRCKGELVPWVFTNLDTGQETYLYELSKEEVDEAFPDEKIAELIGKSINFEVGIYPACDDEETCERAEEDVFTNREGSVELWIGDELFTRDFTFDIELNIY